MVVIHHAKVEDGQLVLPEALDLPDGAEVVVTVELAADASASGATGRVTDLRSLPAFGMWANREDMQDSVAWVRRQREAWSDRLNRSD